MLPTDNRLVRAAEPYEGSSLEYAETVVSPDLLTSVEEQPTMASTAIFRLNKVALIITGGALSVIVLIGIITFALSGGTKSHQLPLGSNASNYALGSLPVEQITADKLSVGSADHLTINGKLEVAGGILLAPGAAPGNATAGELYYDKNTNAPYYFNGTGFVSLAPAAAAAAAVNSLGGLSGAVGVGTGLQINGKQLAVSSDLLQSVASAAALARANISTPRVASLQGLTGDVNFTAGAGIGITGTTITNNGVVSLASGSVNLSFTSDGKGNYTIADSSVSASGTVTIGPAAAQTDTSANTSVSINKTAAGNFLDFASNGSSKFVIDQTGKIVTGTIPYTSVTGVPASVSSIGGATGAITLGSGLSLAGNTLSATGSSGSGVISVVGTANQIAAVTAGSGNVTVSLPASVTTTNLQLNNNLTVNNAVRFAGLTGGVVLADGAGNLSSAVVDRNSAYFNNVLSVANGGTGAATLTTNGILYGAGNGAIQATSANTNSILATNGSGTPSLTQALPAAVQGNITSTGILASGSIASGFGTINTTNVISTSAVLQGGSLSVAAGKFTVAGASGNIVTTGTASIQGNGGISVGVPGSVNGTITLSNTANSNLTTIQGLAPAGQSQTITIPASSVASDTVCLLSLANCVGTGSGVVASGGTQNYLTKFTNAGGNQIGNSLIFDNGSRVGVNTATPNASYVLDVNGATNVSTNLNVGNNLTVTGGVRVSSLTGGIVKADGAGNLSSGTVALGTDTIGNYVSTIGTLVGLNTTGNSGGGSTPTLTVLYGSSANTAVQGNTSITCASGTGNLSGGGGTITLGVGGSCGALSITNSPTFSGALTVQGAGGIGVGVAGTTDGTVNFANSGSTFTGSLKVAALGQATTYTLPDPGSASTTICLSTGNCAGAGGGITGVGTAGKLAIFSATGSIADSTLSESGSTLTASGSVVIQGANSLSVGTSSLANGSVKFYGSTGTHTVSLQAPSSDPASDLVFKLPSAYGGSGSCLQSDGAGGLSFNSCTGGAGGGVTSLNGQGGVLTLSNASTGSSTITIDSAKADASTKGIATFNATNFSDNGSGLINTIQNIATTSSPVFASVNGTTGLNTGVGVGAQRIDAAGNVTAAAGSFTGRVSGADAVANNEFATLQQVNGAVIGASGSYIANSTSPQAGANFNIGASGVIGGTLSVTGATTLSGTLTVNGPQLTNNGSTLNTSVAISDKASGGAIGSAAATVDIATSFNVNQTTAGQTLTLASPTSSIAGRIVYVSNVGSASFTMHGVTLAPATSQSFIWNGTAWVSSTVDGAGAGGSGVTTVGALNGGTANANGATISATTIYLQSASGSFPGLVDTAAQTFAGAKTFSGAVSVQGAGSFTAGGTGLAVTNSADIGGTLAVTGLITGGTYNGQTISSAASFTGTVTAASTIQGTQLISTATTGTAPFSVASTTKVANFNADLLDGLDSTAFALSTGSGNYIQNTSTQQVGANFNIDGTAVIGSTLSITGATTATGLVTANGGVAVANNSNFSQVGSGSFSTGSGAVSLNGATTVSGPQLTNNGSTLFSADVISDKATGGPIGSAVTTVDVKTSFNIAQTTAGQTLSLPTPTANTTAGRIAYVLNTGTANFTMHGVNIASSAAQIFIYNGSTWAPGSVDGAGNGVTTVGALNGGTANATGASISSNTIYLQAASGSFAGLVDTGTQTFAGAKTFSGGVIVQGTGSFTAAGTGLAVTNNASVAGVLSVGTGGGIVATFTGRVSGGDAVSNNEFTTLQQVNTAISSGVNGASGNYIANSTGLQSGANFNIGGAGIIGGALTVAGAATFTGSGNGTTVAGALFKNSTNSATALQIQNAAGTSLFTTDTANNNIIIGGNNSGELQPWQTNANSLPAPRSSASQVYLNGYIYLIGGTTDTTSANSQSTIYYAKVNGNGSTGTWQTSPNALPVAINAQASVTANGYIYVLGGSVSAANVSTVYYAKANSDGTTGPWLSTTSLPQRTRRQAAAVSNGYIYSFGGTANGFGLGDFADVYYAKLSADGTIGNWLATTSLPTTLRSITTSATVANGYVYIVGGFQDLGAGYLSTTYYAKFNADGTIGSWNTGTALPVAQACSGLQANGYLYCISGNAASGNLATTLYAPLNSDGSIGSWTQAVQALPVAQNTTNLIINGYIYSLGGYDGTNSYSTVYYASTQRTKIGGSLDLVGLSSGNLADGQSGLGGELTAGNTNVIGKLRVSGTAVFGQSVGIMGNLTASSDVTLGSTSSDSILVNGTLNSNTKLTVGRAPLVIVGLGGAPATPTLNYASNLGGTLLGTTGTTYYYKISSQNTAGESLASSETSIAANSFAPLRAPGAPGVAAPSANGAVTLGTHSYKVTYVTAVGETVGGPTSNQVNVATYGNQTVALSGIRPGPAGTTQRNIYRTVAGDTGNYKLVATLANNTATTLSDTFTDASLGADIPVTNTAGINAPGAPGVAAPSAGGSVTIGTHSYEVTFITANGESVPGTTSIQVNVTTGGTQTVALSAIPLGPAGTTQRKIYRTVAGDTGSYLVLTTLANNTTTTFNDTIPDASLGAVAPSTNTATTDTNMAYVYFPTVSGATSYRIYRGTTSGAENAYQTATTSPFVDNGAAGTAATVATSDGTARLGVGTRTPSANLHVVGTALFQSSVDTNTAFQIQNATGSSLFTADTTNNRINLSDGNAATANLLVLDTSSVAPTAVAGGIYFDSTSSSFKCSTDGSTFTGSCFGTGTDLQGAYNASSSPATITTSSASKNVVIKSGATFNSTGAFQVQDASATAILNVDTVNKNIALNGNLSVTQATAAAQASASLALNVAGGTGGSGGNGAGLNGGNGGGTTVQGGSGGNGSATCNYTTFSSCNGGSGGVITLATGSGGTGLGYSGSGGGANGGSGGNLVLSTGNGGQGGGDSGSGGNGGSIQLTAGNGANTNALGSGGSGGSITLTAGSAASRGGNGGSITLQAQTGDTFYGGSNGAIKLNPSGGNVIVGGVGNVSGAGFQVTGSQQGNVITDIAGVSGTTITESGKALAYYLGCVVGGGCNTTFNVTGLSSVEGAYAYFYLSPYSVGSSTTSLQINGQAIATASAAGGGNKPKAFIVMYINGAWRIMAYGNTNSQQTFDTSDYAEYIHYSGNTKPQPGDVLTVGDEDISAKLSNTPYDQGLIGVVSTDPFQTGGADDGHSVIMALTGRVPVKVSLENGPIARGDYLTSSSTPGVAMKATKPGNVIGTALSSYDGTQSTATVTVQLKNGYADPTNGQSANNIQGSLAVSGNLNLLGSASIDGNLNVSGNTTLANLTVTGNAIIQGTLTVASITVDTITVSGHVVTAGDAPATQALTAAGQGAAVVIDGNDTAGTITITTGATGLSAGDLGKISFKNAFGKAPKVVLSAQDDTSINAKIFPASKTASGYVLKTAQSLAPNTTYTFDYFIVQ